MEPLSIASLTLASILSSLPATDEQVSQSVITTHISPAIAGQWEIDLKRANELAALADTDNKAVASETTGGVLDQSERRIIQSKPNSIPNSAVKTSTAAANSSAQCREVYNFAADNEMWAVSGKEWTYGRYLVTHRDEGLPLIVIKTIYDNNEVDCSGNQIDQTDEALIAYLKYDDTQMQWCADPDGKQCFMNFNRVLP